MEISTDPNALNRVLQHLEDRLPHSIYVFHLVRHIRDKTWDNTQVFVDSTEEAFTTLLCHGPSLGSDDANIGGWSVYGTDGNKLTALLDKVGVTRRRLDGFHIPNTVMLYSVDDKFLKATTEYMNNHGFSMEKKFTYRLYMRNLEKGILADSQQKTPKLPEGYKLAPLRPEHASLIVSKTPYCGPNAYPLMRKMIEKLPSFAVYPTTQEDPVSWALLHENGSPGFGFTLPEYRNMKFLQIIGEAMKNHLFTNGYKQMSFEIADGNTSALQVSNKFPGLVTLDLIHFMVFKRTTFISSPQSAKL